MLSLSAIRKRHGRTVALDGVDLSVAEGERLAVVGPSGCGKTTLLRAIAGLDAPDGGHVEIAGRDATRLAPHERGVAMVMQSGALYPHLRVRANIEFPLRMMGMAAAEIARRVDEVAELLGIGDLLGRRPATLSGGERQRVALARALAHPASILLLDEPFAALDAPLRLRLRTELRAILDRVRRTVVLVTHDQEEAIALGQRIAVMESGRLLQVGAVRELLEAPGSRRVASFIGSPPMAFVPVSLRRESEAWIATAGTGADAWRVRLPDGIALDVADGTDAVLGLRGGLDWSERRDARPNDDAVLRAVVIGTEALGGHVDARVSVAGGTEMTVRRAPDFRVEVGAPIAFAAPPSAFHLFARGADGARLSTLGPSAALEHSAGRGHREGAATR